MSESKAALLTQIEDAVLDENASVAAALRKCLVLGGKAGSDELREWARQELMGYESKDDVPEYRVVGAPILIDGVSGYNLIKGQRIGVFDLPEEAREYIGETVHLLQGIGTIEQMANSAGNNEGAMKLAPPGSAELASYMTGDLGQQHTQIQAVYWAVSEVSLRGVVDHVRTMLAELVAEVRAAQPDEQAEPQTQQVQQAVNVIIGGKARVGAVNTSQAASGDGQPEEVDSAGWSTTKKVWSFVVGLATVLAAIIALMVWHPWH